jgi:hypothetical protein
MIGWPLHLVTLECGPGQPGLRRWPIRRHCVPGHGRRLVREGVGHRWAAPRNAWLRIAPDRLCRALSAKAAATVAVTA